MITDRKAALRRKKAIVEEIEYLRELQWKQTILVGAIPIVSDHIEKLQAEFDELEHRFPTDMKRGVRMGVFMAA